MDASRDRIVSFLSFTHYALWPLIGTRRGGRDRESGKNQFPDTECQN